MNKTKIKIELIMDREDGTPDSIEMDLDGDGRGMLERMDVIVGTLVSNVIMGIKEKGVIVPPMAALDMVASGGRFAMQRMEELTPDCQAKPEIKFTTPNDGTVN